MSRSVVPSSGRRGTGKRAAPESVSLPGSPLTFILTGYAWLGMSYLLGIALLIGLVYGTPLPRWLKPVHVHGALVGGVLQCAIAGLLLSLARVSDRKEAYAQSRSALFLTFNAATAGLLLSFWLGNMTIAGLAGLVLTGSVLPLMKTAWIHFGEALRQPTGAAWIYRSTLISLLGGLVAGIAMALHFTDGLYAHARLAHIHLIILGFVTVGFIVALHQLLPALLEKPLTFAPITRFAFWFLPAGFLVLLGAFLLSAVWLQIAVGCLLLASLAWCTVNLLSTWLKAGSPGTAATDHLLMGAFFLVLATAIGLAMSANYLRDPPVMPIGSLHLVAYTHLAFIGFVTQVIFGALSSYMPGWLAVMRVPNPAKRELYRTKLEGIMNRWRTVQLGGLSLGTMAMSALAALTWGMPLGAVYVQTTVWVAASLLLASLMLFTAKLAWAVGLRPS
jgi:hypothetical protein